MDLDFTKLENIATTPAENNTSNITQGKTFNNKNEIQGNLNDNTSIQILQKDINQNKTDIERARAVYKEYQKNIRLSGSLITEITKGLKAGENTTLLLLKAVKAISLMTSDEVFYSQAERDIREIYGVGLQEQEPLKLELEQITARLNRLINSAAVADAEYKPNIQRAIKAHKTKKSAIEQMIKKL